MMNRQLKRNLPLLGISCLLFLALLRHERSKMQEELSRKIVEEISMKTIDVQIAEQNATKSKSCDISTVITSAKLESRFPWPQDSQCSKYQIRHMISHCRKPIALASYPGSGNTWVRYLIEGATGIFTGSRYKDLQIQMYGLYGEIRDWSDGTTIVQKTHDANDYHVKNDFGGRAILILRNPYSAILSDHNFLFAGHHGRAPDSNYERKDWTQFVTIQASKWLDMATNWTVHSTPEKVLVLHYERLGTDLSGELRKVLIFLGLPIDEDKLRCVAKHRGGFFRRKQFFKEPEKVPFNVDIRKDLDVLIDETNGLLKDRGYEQMPLESYDFYRKSDEDIIQKIKVKNAERKDIVSKEEKEVMLDKSKGTKMVLQQYFKWLESDDKTLKIGFDEKEDMKTVLMKHLFRKFREGSKEKTLTGLSEQAEGLLTKAVELWPIIQKPFQRDPIEDVILQEGFRGKNVAELLPNLLQIRKTKP